MHTSRWRLRSLVLPAHLNHAIPTDRRWDVAVHQASFVLRLSPGSADCTVAQRVRHLSNDGAADESACDKLLRNCRPALPPASVYCRPLRARSASRLSQRCMPSCDAGCRVRDACHRVMPAAESDAVPTILHVAPTRSCTALAIPAPTRHANVATDQSSSVSRTIGTTPHAASLSAPAAYAADSLPTTHGAPAHSNAARLKRTDSAVLLPPTRTRPALSCTVAFISHPCISRHRHPRALPYPRRLMTQCRTSLIPADGLTASRRSVLNPHTHLTLRCHSPPARRGAPAHSCTRVRLPGCTLPWNSLRRTTSAPSLRDTFQQSQCRIVHSHIRVHVPL